MKDYYHKILHGLELLKKTHPEHTMGKHLCTILDGQDVWGISDKELSKCIDQYIRSTDLDGIHPDTEIEKIIHDGMCLDRFKLYEEADPIEDL
jgi:hypothetical protein